jgi:hypothetical protein
MGALVYSKPQIENLGWSSIGRVWVYKGLNCLSCSVSVSLDTVEVGVGCCAEILMEELRVIG